MLALAYFQARQTFLLPGSILLLSLIIRLSFISYGPPLENEIWSDMEMYVRSSIDIHNGVWKPIHFFQSIGFPLFINALEKITTQVYFTLSMLQALASVMILYFTYRLVMASFGFKVGVISLCLGCIHLPWILYAGFALPEIFFTFLLSINAWMTYKICHENRASFHAPAWWGLSFICAFWLKGTHALWGPIFFIGLMVCKRKQSLKPIFIIGSIVSMGLAAHGYLTYSKIGKIQLSASTGGLNFIEGKCPDKRNSDSAGYSWLSPLYYQLGSYSTKQWDRPFTDSGYYFQQGLTCIKNNPLVLIQSLESIPYLFYGNHMWPFNRKSYGNHSRLYDLFFAFFSVVGLTFYWLNFKFSKVTSQEFIIWSLPVLSFFLCVYIFKSELRYRVPFDIWIIPLGVKGWLFLLEKRRLS